MYQITALYAGILAIVLVALSVRVIRHRLTGQVSLGDGGGVLSPVIRAHGNFIEYVPMALILIGLLESRGTAGWLLHLLGIVLVVARLAHPFGLVMKPPNAARAIGITGTLLVILAAGVLLLLSVLFNFKV
jgi:uncharacterized membrane protein YecN with MAPEG domain